MVKTSTRKKTPSKQVSRVEEQKKKKLPRGYKQCGNCRTLLNIHKYVCHQCGHKHDMKKKKVDILKNLNNLTPKLLRSLIELNDFNCIVQSPSDIGIFPSNFMKVDQSVPPQQYKKRKSSKSSTVNKQSKIAFDKKDNISYVKFGTSLASICPVVSDILIAENIQKWADFSQSQKITIRAYGLQKYHKIGQIYRGKTILHFISNKRLQFKISVDQHIVKMKSLANRIALLTGKGSVIIADLDIHQKYLPEHIFELKNCPEIKVDLNDQIMVIQWIKTHSSAGSSTLLVGTLMGHLYIYKIAKLEIEVVRFICNAHFEAITALAECPLGNNEECLFASGSFDGTLSIWSINEKQCIYKIQASNKKIYSLVWDPGAKFIFVVRDQNQDSGVLACFFAILKSQQSVALSDQIDFRLIRNTTNCIAIHHPQSNNFCLIDQYQSTLRVVQLEQLRKNSLKRKKVKREQGQKTFELVFGQNGLMKVLKMNEQQEMVQKMNEKYLPLPNISDACQMRINEMDVLWGVTYDGYLFEVDLQ